MLQIGLGPLEWNKGKLGHLLELIISSDHRNQCLQTERTFVYKHDSNFISVSLLLTAIICEGFPKSLYDVCECSF